MICSINNYHNAQHYIGLSGMSTFSLYSHDDRPTDISQTELLEKNYAESQ